MTMPDATNMQVSDRGSQCVGATTTVAVSMSAKYTITPGSGPTTRNTLAAPGLRFPVVRMSTPYLLATG